jgi:hypothetical protein
MSKPKKFDEYDFLNLFYRKMVRVGQAHNLIRLSVNARMVEDVYEESVISVTENHLQEMSDICLANSWVEHTTMGTGQYGNLQLTTTGLGVAKSKRKQIELLNNRSFFKKISDYIIEEHKGLFILLGFLSALAGLLIKYYGSNGNG